MFKANAKSLRCGVAICVFLLCHSHLCFSEEEVVFSIPKYNDLIVVPLTINGTQHHCIVDSGTSLHSLDVRLEKLLGNKRDTKTANTAANEDVPVSVFDAPAAKLGAMELDRRLPIAVMDFTHLREATGRPIEGILGLPLFMSAIVQIDFDNATIKFLPLTTAPQETWGKPIYVSTISNHMPAIEVSFPGDINESCGLDTGNDETMSMRTDLYDKLLVSKEITASSDSSSITVNGQIISQRAGRLSKMEFGMFRLAKLTVSESQVVTRLGMGFFRCFRVTFDLGHGRIFLTLRDHPDEARIRLDPGIVLRRRSGRTEVVEVTSQGLAEAIGILANDELVEVDGINVQEMPLAEIRWMLQTRAGLRRFPVKLRRGNWDKKASSTVLD